MPINEKTCHENQKETKEYIDKKLDSYESAGKNIFMGFDKKLDLINQSLTQLIISDSRQKEQLKSIKEEVTEFKDILKKKVPMDLFRIVLGGFGAVITIIFTCLGSLYWSNYKLSNEQALISGQMDGLKTGLEAPYQLIE